MRGRDVSFGGGVKDITGKEGEKRCEGDGRGGMEMVEVAAVVVMKRKCVRV